MITEELLQCRSCLSTSFHFDGDRWTCRCCGDPLAEVAHCFDAPARKRRWSIFPWVAIVWLAATLLTNR